MLNMKAKLSYLRTFTGSTLPNIVGELFTSILCRLHRHRNVLINSPLYDVVNAGDKHRFTVLGSQPMLVSNSIQNSGHQILVMQIYLLVEELNKRPIEWYPYIMDFHDEVIIEVKEGHQDMAVEAFNESYRRLNEELLKGEIVISGEPDMGYSLAAFKIEDFDEKEWLPERYGCATMEEK